MIYLDNAASARMFDEVIDSINLTNKKEYFNPSALYLPSNQLTKSIDDSRQTIANKLCVKAGEIYFTSCATESNNWAIFKGFKNKKGNIVVSSGEHASVYSSCMELKNKGFTVRFSPLNSDGTINVQEFDRLVDENISLVSVIHCSNESGAVNDIFDLAKRVKLKNKNCIFHSDGVQAFTKFDYDIGSSEVDLYSVSGHKIGAPKGVAALYVSNKISIAPLIFGGGQESGLRSGTENVSGIIGFASALKCHQKYYNQNSIKEMSNHIKTNFVSKLENIKINSNDNAVADIISISIDGLKAEILQRILAQENVLIGLGSACAAKSSTNRVLKEMGLSKKMIEGSIRLSLDCFNNFDEIKKAVEIMIEKIQLLRGKISG